MKQKQNLAILIVAAGNGERMGAGILKQYRLLGGEAVLRRAILAFGPLLERAALWVVIHPTHRELFARHCGDLSVAGVVEGGDTRQASVYNGLLAMRAAAPECVLIHDAARPCVTSALAERVLAGLSASPAVIPAVTMTDTLKRVQGNAVSTTLPREGVVTVQTPQGFDYAKLLAAHERFRQENFTDDAALMEAAGHAVTWVEGERNNLKLTMPEDWAMAEALKDNKERRVRTGFGYDVHRLLAHAPATPLDRRTIRLGGIDIAHTHFLEGHSDADVVLHALTDALLGAACAGDIGSHFPPSEARWKNVDSSLFVAEAMRLLRERGGEVRHADLTVICERPKIGPHREVMRARIAELLNISAESVNVKATTTEGLGFTGREEGIAAHAVVTAYCI